jgi:hypothetical protein
MYKSVFKSSKMALLFAGMTLVSAISMIGTQEDQGLLTRTVEQIEDRAAASGSMGPGYGGGDGSSAAENGNQPVFGEYKTEAAPAPAPAPINAGNTGPASYANPMSAPLSPTAVVVPPGAPLPQEYAADEGTEAPYIPE